MIGLVNRIMNKNVFGEELITCSSNPITGYFRNGCCDTDETDKGLHTVCVVITNEFLEFSSAVGNDLLTSIPEYNFPGLKEGDRWCLCALRWKQALIHNCAPKVVLESTNEKTLEIVSMDDLIKHSHE